MLQSLYVRDFMTKSVLSFKPQQDIIEAATILATRGYTGAPVLSDTGELAGILSDTDCIRATIKYGFDPDWRGTVDEFMTKNVVTVDIDDSVLTVAERFCENRFRRYPVMSDNRLVGQISRIDVLKALGRIKQKIA